MQGDQDEVIHKVLRGTLAMMLVECDMHHIATKKKDNQCYIQLMKGLYWCLRATIQFWKKLTDQLVLWGFVINPYDLCVVNKVMDRNLPLHGM